VRAAAPVPLYGASARPFLSRLEAMAFSTLEARQELLDAAAEAVGELGFALASLGAAFEQLDEPTADKLEEELFRPAQLALGRAKRTHAGFAARHGMGVRDFEPQEAGLPSRRAKGFIEDAAEAVSRADRALAGLQDSPMLLEVGDAELRAGVSGARELIADLPRRARELLRRVGR
jgi:hypothetical protein